VGSPDRSSGQGAELQLARPGQAFRIYLLRSFLAPVTSARWTRFIRTLHAGLGVAPPIARVLGKPVRAYVHRAFSPRRRLALLLEHYRWLQLLFSREFVAKICAGETFAVATLRGRSGDDYGIFLAASVVTVTQREGELAFYFAKGPGGEKLCRISFCFAKVDGDLAIVVGGIQGPLSIHKRAIISATRDLHGLRPKDATFLAVRALAQALQIDVVHAVCDASHVLGRLQDTAKHSRYDAYWLERGGVARGPYGFVFGALEPTGASLDRRAAAKIAIIDGVSALVRSATATGATSVEVVGQSGPQRLGRAGLV
jgi:uncharacterized protein VirK/YbjX